NRAVLDFRGADFHDGGGGAAHPGGLLDERHHRDFRPHSRKSEAVAPRAPGSGDEPGGKPDVEPDDYDLRPDVPDGNRTLPVRWTRSARFLIRIALRDYCWNVFFSVYCESNCAVLPQLDRSAEARAGAGGTGDAHRIRS